MKILITSGGTKIKIDSVRSITNMSKGTFGSKIADEFFNHDHEIYFLGAVDSKRPFFAKCNSSFLEQKRITKNEIGNNYKIFTYVTFEDYQKELFELLKNNKFDAIILAAAVSDFGIAPEKVYDGKISSKNDMKIDFIVLPKLIERVREFAEDSFIVGFKLLVNSTKEELDKACNDQLRKNNVNIVVGNDLRDIKNDNHTLTIYSKNKIDDKDVEGVVYSKKDFYLPNVIYNQVMNNI